MMADDFKTLAGKEYKNATVTGVEPDGIVVKTKTGISKLYFVQLPKEVQQRFNYNPQGAATYSAQQAIQYEINRKEQEAARYHQEDVEAQKRASAAAAQAANANAQVAQDNKLVRQQQETAREANRHQEATDAISAYRATHTHKHHYSR
jgi:hypothetical protein